MEYMKWNFYYRLAKKYYDYNGNLLVNSRFRTINGINYDENGYALGRWIRLQREAYQKKEYSNSKITEEQINMLEDIGMQWSVKKGKPWFQTDMDWEIKYQLCQTYYQKNGHIMLPKNFKTKDGIHYDEKGHNLYVWLLQQKGLYQKNPNGGEKISEERIKKLNDLDIEWQFDNNKCRSVGYSIRKWKSTYLLAKKYYEEYGNLDVPADFITSDGITKDEKGINLGQWIKLQRSHYAKREDVKYFTQAEIDKLNEIGMIWEKESNAKEVLNQINKNTAEEKWKSGYEHAKEYYQKHNNLDVKDLYVCQDSFPLGMWVTRQRSLHKQEKLSSDKIAKLEELKITWNGKEIKRKKTTLEEYYQLISNYREHYGNLSIPADFKTLNGVDYDDEGIELGRWLKKQLIDYKDQMIGKQRYADLSNYGMIWNENKNNEKLNEFFDKHNIDKAYQEQLKRLPYKEIALKFRYLKDQKIPYNENGQLHSIFFISDKNMQAVYGVSLEELSNMYIRKK